MSKTKAEEATNQPQSQVGYIQFIKDPCMDWSADDSLYVQLKMCKHIKVKHSILPEPRKCKTYLHWLGDQDLGKYQAWNLQVTSPTSWHKWHEFCRPQPNELYASNC